MNLKGVIMVVPTADGRRGKIASTSRFTLKDIADELGISQTAVSFAINDRPGVSEATKRRVKQLAAQHGWSPVYAAQALGSSKTMTIGFAPSRSTDVQNETFMLHFMAGLHASFSHKGYGLLYRPCSSLKEEVAVYRDWARRKRVDGVILVDLRADDPRPALLKELGVPAVLAGGPDPSDVVPSLSIDDSRTMETILDHLSLLGHRKIAYISGDPDLDYSKERKKAFLRFAEQKHLDGAYVEFTDFDTTKAVESTQRFLASNEPPTAFIYETEILAVSSLRSITEILVARIATDSTVGVSRRYPYNLPAIVSFEDSFICEAAYPSITAVHRDAGEYGTKIANLLLKLLNGEQVSGNRKILTPKLIIRESTKNVVV